MEPVQSVNLITAFSGGLLSFFSPCVLPLIPVYLSFVSGLTFEQMTREEDRKKTFFTVFFNTLLFVLGFSTVFTALGLGASTIGQFLKTYQSQVSVIAGMVILVLALHFMGLLRIKWLYYEKRVQVKKRRFGPLSSFLLGLAFAFGWTPCIGPILASILLLASQQEGVGAGLKLLGAYSAGMAIPFLATAMFLNTFLGFFKKVNKHFETIEIAIGGVLMVAAAFLIYSQFEHIVSANMVMGAVALTMLGIIIARPKIPRAAFVVVTAIVVGVIAIGGGGLYFFGPEPLRAEDVGALTIQFDDFHGNEITLSEYGGKPILLNFFASWCGPCKKEIPELVSIHNEKTHGRFSIVGINCDEETADGKAFVDEMKIPYPVLHGKVGDLTVFGERTALPTNLILDGQGRKIKSYTGFPGEEILLNDIEKLLAGNDS
jgi:cytochrome c-type biogenesis protein